jgi:thiol-disulfide isomerase/thioredoxin
MSFFLPSAKSICASSDVIYSALFIAIVIIWLWSWNPFHWSDSERCSAPPSIHNTEGMGDSHKKVKIVNYNASWCGHSVRLKPTWSKLQQAFKGHPDVDIVDFVCDKDAQHDKICNAKGIQGFPTIVKELPSGKTVEYRGNRTFDDIYAFATSS